jgi:hypothetical protein
VQNLGLVLLVSLLSFAQLIDASGAYEQSLAALVGGVTFGPEGSSLGEVSDARGIHGGSCGSCGGGGGGSAARRGAHGCRGARGQAARRAAARV